MARYQKVLPMVDSQANTFAQIQQYLTAQGFQYRTRNGEQVFQKGKGIWLAPSFVKITYYGNFVRLEAWVDAMGAEEGLEGFVGSAAKGPIKKAVPVIEQILSRPGADYVPRQEPAPAEEETASRVCANCGAELTPGGKFCGKCGQMVDTPAVPDDGPKLPESITKREYFKKYAGESFTKNLKVAAITGYVCAGINAVVSLWANPFGLVDSVIFLALALGMHLAKSKLCAIGMLVYAIGTVLTGLVLSGTFSGWLWIVAGVTAVMVFSNAEKRYKELTAGRR